MYFIPFVVGVGFQKLRGQTWLSATATSTAIVWTSAQIRKGAILRVATAANTVMSMTLWNVTAGVGLGILGGIGVSTLLFGEEGKEDAIDFYTGKVSTGKYVETVVKGIGSIPERTRMNRAVPGNALGLPTGTNPFSHKIQQERDAVMSGESWYTTPDSGRQGSWYSTPGG